MKRTPEEIFASILANLRMARSAVLAEACNAFDRNDLETAKMLNAKHDGMDQVITLIVTESEKL